MVKRKTPHPHSSIPVPLAHIALRPTKRPTVEVHMFDGPRIQEVVIGLFKKHNYMGIDLDALIHFTLQSFEVSIVSYEYMHKTVRAYIMENFAIHQGEYIRLSEVSLRRVIVCYTIDPRIE